MFLFFQVSIFLCLHTENLCVFLLSLIQQICVFPIPTLLHATVSLYLYVSMSLHLHTLKFSYPHVRFLL